MTAPVPTATVSTILFRSDNLIIWEELPVTFSAWNVAATFDGGFVSNAYDGYVMFSPDGRSWERTDRFPPLFYQSWGDRLVGLDYSSTPSLVVFDGEQAATIELPPRSASSQYGVFVTPGAAGLATILGSFEGEPAEPITRVDGYLLAMDNGLLRIDEPSGETSLRQFRRRRPHRRQLISQRPIRSGSIIQTGARPSSFRSRCFSISDGESARGLSMSSCPVTVWNGPRARPVCDPRMPTSSVVPVRPSSSPSTTIGRDYRELPITVYRTGPIG